MKLGAKMFFCITIFFSVAFLFGGYLLISYFYDITMEREIEMAVEQYQYHKFVVQANLIMRGEEWFHRTQAEEYDLDDAFAGMNGMTALLAMDGTELFSDFSGEAQFDGLLQNITQNHVSYRFITAGARRYLLTAGSVMHGDAGVYLVAGNGCHGRLGTAGADDG